MEQGGRKGGQSDGAQEQLLPLKMEEEAQPERLRRLNVVPCIKRSMV